MWMTKWSELEPAFRPFRTILEPTFFPLGSDLEPTFRSFDDLRQRMNALFQEFTGESWLSGLRAPGAWLRANLYDTGEELVLCVLTPGLTDKDVNVTATKEGLTIAGERKADAPKGYSIHRQERDHRAFSRSFILPCSIDPEKTEGTVKDGVLTVHMAKSAEAQPRHIDVKTA
jgi:HSP20 family protein